MQLTVNVIDIQDCQNDNIYILPSYNRQYPVIATITSVRGIVEASSVYSITTDAV